MKELADLMQHLLKLQSGGSQRSLEWLAEDERSMDGLGKKRLGEEPIPTTRPHRGTPKGMRFEI